MTTTDRMRPTVDQARRIAAQVLQVEPVDDVVNRHVGVDLVVRRLPSEQFGLVVTVYADVNDPVSVSVTLDREGERLQTIRLTDVTDDVAVAVVRALLARARGNHY